MKGTLKGTRKYTHTDPSGMLWRFNGSRPISQLADLVMRECGLPLPGIRCSKGKKRNGKTRRNKTRT